MFLEEGHGAAEDGVVEVIADVRDHAEAGVVDEVGAGVVAGGLEDGGGDQRVGDDRPGVVEVMGDEKAEVEDVVGPRNLRAEDDIGGGVRAQDVVEDELDEQHAKGGHQADEAHEDHGADGVERVGAGIVQQSPDASHADGLRSRI